ncbi:hypothetical protein KPH14_001908 [Odynerus spinipes]|uniref:Uncharacterized protein n=1 Tax=Odynerus spinipes TaxID=1348599 RepID=A0AAD9S030_9HYME|nr:hypothetical protein KPH14_001908 [Odynerus spinipes]
MLFNENEYQAVRGPPGSNLSASCRFDQSWESSAHLHTMKTYPSVRKLWSVSGSRRSFKLHGRFIIRQGNGRARYANRSCAEEIRQKKEGEEGEG